MVRYSCRINTENLCFGSPNPRPGQGDIFAPARNLVRGLGKIWGDFSPPYTVLMIIFWTKIGNVIWVIWCFSGLVFLLLTMFFFLNVFRFSKFLPDVTSKVGSEESKCREGLRVTYESEIEVMGCFFFFFFGRDCTP